MATLGEEYVLLSEPLPGVRLLQLNDPSIHNAMTSYMTKAWDAAIDELEADESVRAVVVTGRGQSFCSGADLTWLDAAEADEITPDRIRQRMIPFYRSWTRLLSAPYPTIAAMNGPTIGAGLALALTCELRYAAPTATFSAPFVHLGTHPGIAITHTLPEAVGISKAKEMFYTGLVLDANEAQEAGLTLSTHDDIVGYCLDVAATIASAAPIASRLLKAGLANGQSTVGRALEWETIAQPTTLATHDLHEGVRARMEHRAPLFVGH